MQEAGSKYDSVFTTYIDGCQEILLSAQQVAYLDLN